MTSLADGLPPEIAAAISPEWRANEVAYWTVRPALLASHHGLWIAFAGGEVVASGRRPVEVLHAAKRAGGHPYVACVGFEERPSRIRRVAFPYDSAYLGEPVPQLVAEFRVVSGTPGVTLDRVIVDTGADNSVLPWSDCTSLGLDPYQGVPSRIVGVAGSSTVTLSFSIWVFLDGQEFPCQLQADLAGDERILGRDVLNRMDVLFRGPAGEVVFNP